jgi:hypothetical protein
LDGTQVKARGVDLGDEGQWHGGACVKYGS